MNSIAEIVQWACKIVPAVASALIVVQLILMKRQIMQDHDRSRRENTVRILTEWCMALKEETNVAEAIAQELSLEDCRNLYNRHPFEIKEHLFDMLSEICPEPLKKTDDKCIVQGEGLNILRWHVISYLNILETTLLAWKMGIVEKNVVEIQFASLCDDTQGRDFLHNMRKAADGYPVIEEFREKLVERKRHSGNGPTYSEIEPPRKAFFAGK